MFDWPESRKRCLPTSSAVTCRQLRDRRMVRTRDFIAERILLHHPDSEKFRELVVETTV